VVTVMTEIRDADKSSVSRCSPPPSSSEHLGNGRPVTESSTGTWNNGSVEDVVSEGARSASISPSRPGPFPVEVLHADLEVQAPPLIDEEVSVGGVLSASAAAANLESPCSLLPIESASLPPSTHADPLLRMDSQDIMNLDLLDYFAQGSFEEELAKLQQPVVSDPESQPGMATYGRLRCVTPSSFLPFSTTHHASESCSVRQDARETMSMLLGHLPCSCR
jgi:hypothetical protein